MADIMMVVDTAVITPVNRLPLIDDTDFKTIEAAVAYNAAGMDLRWNFVTSAGVQTSTAVTPTTSGSYDWTHLGDGIYSMEIPASGGASANNDTEGFGWWSGVCTGVLPWAGPIIQFSPANIVNSMVTGSDLLDVNVAQISEDATAANNAESFFDGTGYAGTGNVIPTVTTLTNLPAITANWLTAAGIAAGALDGKGNWNIGKTGYTLTPTTGLGAQTADITGTVSGNATPAQVAAVLTTQITEAYRANGAAPTLAQFMSEVLAHLGEASISGTTKTINGFDHTTPAETYTLDDATNPSSITRAS